MSVSDKDRVLRDHNFIGIGMKSTVVTETQKLSRAYPQPLVSKVGVSVSGFTVTLNLVLSGKPEATERSRRVLNEISDLIENFISGLDSNIGTDKQSCHCSSPLGSEPGARNTVCCSFVTLQEAANISSSGVGGACSCGCADSLNKNNPGAGRGSDRQKG